MNAKILKNTKYNEMLISKNSEVIYNNIVKILNEEFDKISPEKKIKTNIDKIKNANKINKC